MAAQVLRPPGFEVDVVDLATLTGQLGQMVDDQGAQVVLVSDVPPSGFAHVRYICKRLAAKFPDMPIIVGVWGSTLDVEKAHDRLPEHRSLHFVKSLKETVDCAQQLIEGLRLKSETGGSRPDGSRPMGSPPAEGRSTPLV
jgi:hypothetical protein